MNKSVRLLATTLGMMFFTGLAARADEPKEKRFALQIGLAQPLQSSGKNLLSSSPTSSLLQYDLGRYKSGVWGFYAQGVAKSRDFSDAEDDVFNNDMAAGVGLQYRMRSESNPSLYYGAGIGSYAVSTSVAVKNSNGSTTTTMTTETTSSSVLGGRIFVGKNFGKRYFAELAYTMIGSSTLGNTRVNASHASLGVGLRF